MARSLDDTPSFSKDAKWSDFVTPWEFEQDTFHPGRLLGDVWIDYRHRVETKSGKTYPEYCHGFDVDAGKHFEDKEERCECCRLKIPGQYRYYMNWISREAEEQRPAKPKQHWSPIYMIDMSPTLFKRIKELKALNKGISVDDPERGADIQIKFNKNAEAASMYSAHLDEKKNTPITEEQKEYVVVQKYANGDQKVVRGNGKMPGLFEYVRCVSSRDDMLRSLKNNNYYQDQEPKEEEEQPRRKKPVVEVKNSAAKVSQIDAETPIEEDDDDTLSTAVNAAPDVEDEEPAPRAKAVVNSNSTEPCMECPTKFGSFANSIICYTDCAHLWERCKAVSETKDKPVAKASKRARIDDDDDTV